MSGSGGGRTGDGKGEGANDVDRKRGLVGDVLGLATDDLDEADINHQCYQPNFSLREKPTASFAAA